MPSVIVAAVERSYFESSAPGSTAIRVAFTKYTPHTNRLLGAWVGPAPRITRRAILGQFETTATWLYAWDDTPYTTQNWQALQERVRSAVQDGLAELSSDWGDVTVTPYDPRVNGSVQWWQSGSAAVTRTRDEFPTGAGRLDAPENPTGPTTERTHPSTLGTVLGSGVMPWVLGGAALIFLGPPLIGMLSKRR